MRKTPIRHFVRKHQHSGKTVNLYWRGQGSSSMRIASPIIKTPKLNHYIVKYKATHRDGTFNFDTTNSYVKNKKDLIRELQSGYCGTPPIIEIIWAKLQTPPAPTLKPLLDADTRTQSRMNRGYILTNVNISDINVKPIRNTMRFDDNYTQMKATKSVPPIYLTPVSGGRFEIEDGVHRTQSAIKLGYTSIPALVYYGD